MSKWPNPPASAALRHQQGGASAARTVMGPQPLHWKTLARLRMALEDSNLPFRVDGLDWHALAPEFRAVIEAGYEVVQAAKE